MSPSDLGGAPAPDLLDSLADRGAASLHARGRAATSVLLVELPFDCPDPILEIGCGTGETAVRLGRAGYRVIAVDRSSRMLNAAKARARWCGVDERLTWVRTGGNGAIPFRDSGFGAVVVESVLAIQSPETLRALVAEIRRVVRPGGMVLINETVWRSDVSPSLAAELNATTHLSCGIIQSTLDPFDVLAWTRMFKLAGLVILRVQHLDRLGSSAPFRGLEVLRGFRSWTFNFYWRLRTLIRWRGEPSPPPPCLRTIVGSRPVLEGILFILQRPSDAARSTLNPDL